MKPKRYFIEINQEKKEVTIVDCETGETRVVSSVMLLAGGPVEGRGKDESMRIIYGNTNVFATIIEEQVFDSAVECNAKNNWAEHLGFHKMYYGILAGIFRALLSKLPIPFPKHPNQVAPEELLKKWKKEEEERESAWPTFSSEIH